MYEVHDLGHRRMNAPFAVPWLRKLDGRRIAQEAPRKKQIVYVGRGSLTTLCIHYREGKLSSFASLWKMSTVQLPI